MTVIGHTSKNLETNNSNYIYELKKIRHAVFALFSTKNTSKKISKLSLSGFFFMFYIAS